MDILERIKRDKPHHVTIDVENREEPETLRIKRGKGQSSSWVKLQRSLEGLDWIGIQSRDGDGNLLAAYGGPADEEEKPEPIPFDPRESLPEHEDVARYKVLTSAQLTVLEQFNRMAEISFGKQDQLFEMVLIQMKQLQDDLNDARQRLIEQSELLRKQNIESAESQNSMNSAMGIFGSILKEIAPQLSKGALQGLAGQLAPALGMSGGGPSTDGGNGVDSDHSGGVFVGDQGGNDGE